MRRTRSVPAAVAAVAVPLLAACSAGSATGTSAAARTSSTPTSAAASTSAEPFAGLTAKQVLARSAGAMKTARSVHLEGTFVGAGQTMGIDMAMTSAGSASGSIDLGTTGTMKLRRVGSTVYISGDDAFWAQAGAQARTMRGKWLRTTTKSKGFADLVTSTSIGGWATKMLESSGTLRRVAGPSVAGLPTVGLVDDDPKNPSTLYLAATGPAYPLLFASKDKKSRVAFTQWNTAVTAGPPPAKLVAAVG
jgi:hypothetical protein